MRLTPEQEAESAKLFACDQAALEAGRQEAHAAKVHALCASPRQVAKLILELQREVCELRQQVSDLSYRVPV